MNYFKGILMISIALIPVVIKSQREVSPIEGSWGITIDHDGKEAASWLEIKPWGFTKVGRFLHTGGYPRPISVINVKDDKFNFTIP